MGRRKAGQENVRNIQKSHGTYTVSIPIAVMRELGWQEHQRVIVTKSGAKLVVTDYKD